MLDLSFLQVLDLKEKWDKYGRNWKKPDTASPYFLVQVLEMGSPVFFWGGKWDEMGWKWGISILCWILDEILQILIRFSGLFKGRPGGTSHFWQRKKHVVSTCRVSGIRWMGRRRICQQAGSRTHPTIFTMSYGSYGQNDLTESNMIYHPGIVLSHWKWSLRWFALICHSLSWWSFIANC